MATASLIGGAGLGFDFDGELLALQLAVAFESDAVDDERRSRRRLTTILPSTTLALTFENSPVAERSSTPRLTLAWSVPAK